MFTADINRLRYRLRLNSVQREVLIGSILGDGYLYPTVSKKYAYLRMCHGPKQRKYLFWKYRHFKDSVLSPPRYQLQNKNKPDLGGYFWFKTIATPELLEYRKLFYPEGNKIVPLNIGDVFNSRLSLAVWYMDDGCLANKSARFNTQGFSLLENELLKRVLKLNYNISSNIIKSGNIGYGYLLNIPVKDTKKLISLVDPYVRKNIPHKTFLTP